MANDLATLYSGFMFIIMGEGVSGLMDNITIFLLGWGVSLTILS